ncbi:MAG: hypothetical protein WC451_05835 [Patescibacteria group bacterium]|jgi:hypothetical protein
MEEIFDTNKDEQAEIVQKAIDIEKQKRINYGLTFSTQTGFEVLKDILKFTHAFSTSYVPGDQIETAFREGERNVFIYILSNLSDEMKSQIAKEI